MKDIKLIAFDLDGTLFTTDKRITERTYEALRQAAQSGIAIVPATGRFMKTIPEPIKKMDYIKYIIAINGAYVYSCERNETVYKAEIPLDKAIDILKYLDTLNVAYDCYTGNEGFMNEEMISHIDDFIEDRFYKEMLLRSRTPIKELKSLIAERGMDIQKMMAYTRDPQLKSQVMSSIPKLFDNIIVTSSIKENVEINDIGANKGDAVKRIAADMGISMDQVMTFGDSYNDIPMLKTAGYGVCMGNGVQEAKEVSRLVAPTNDEEGVAYIIEKVLEGKIHNI